MHIVKLNATASTNSYLREFCRKLNAKEDVLVWANEQTAGKGQIGTKWEAEPGKNLTFSVFKKVELLTANKQFYITMATSLAIFEILQNLNITNISVKWPNDILAGREKICGVLIESVIKNSKLSAVIIGIGLNVNQTKFYHAPRATSLKLQTGVHFELEELLDKLIQQFYKYVDLITSGNLKILKASYEDKLFRKEKASTFRTPEGAYFTGIIKGVSNYGKLIIQQEDEVFKEYAMKEIELLY